jgi:ankyrin repeat protein
MEAAMTTESPSALWAQAKQAMATPISLWAAAKANDVILLAHLLDEGRPINERDSRGYSPLMLAGYAGNLETVELLLARGADPNTADLFGNTVLMGAAFKGHIKVVQRLLAAGADPSATNIGGLDARGFALTYGRTDVFAILDQLPACAHVGHLLVPPAGPHATN